MQEKRLWLLFVLMSFSVSAQIKGIVVDENNKPIPYVNIWVENENIGTTSEADGTFNLDLKNKEKNLIFSAIGYKKTTTQFKEKTILEKEIYKLDEVVISSLKQTKEIEIGDSKKRFYLPEPQVEPWFLARKFQTDENNKDVKYIKEIIFFTKSEVDNALFRARIYEVKEDSLPGQDLITDEIIVETKKGERKTTVDVSKYKIQIPKEGIVVAFESLLVDQNKYYQQIEHLKPRKKLDILNYAPHIMYLYNDAVESYNRRSGKWNRFTKEYNKKHKEIKLPVPAINLILTN